MSWAPCIAATARPSQLESVVWSPCDRFIAITWAGSRKVDVLDSTTLQRLQTLESPQDTSTEYRVLVFSPDGRILTCSSGSFTNPLDRELFVVSWDIQTGGVASVIRWRVPTLENGVTPSITYSTNGNMIGVYCCRPGYSVAAHIFICDVASGVPMHSHSFKGTTPLSNHIWTHGESLRFATTDATTITIWEVGFSSGVTPTEVETLPAAPDDFGGKDQPVEFLPALCRLAFIDRHRSRVLVWDFRNSRYLLDCTDAKFSTRMSFSSDGRFFACSAHGSDIYLWKETPAGYTLHEIHAFNGNPLLNRNGESTVVFGGGTIQLWRTKGLTTPPSSIFTRAPRGAENFILEFPSDRMLAVFAKKGPDTVPMRGVNTVTKRGYNPITVLNLRSGVPQLTIDARMEVYGLGVIGNTVVVIGDRRVIAWNLPAGDCVPGARVGLEDSSWIKNLGDSPRFPFVTLIPPDLPHDTPSDASVSPDFLSVNPTSASISPDSRHTAFIVGDALTLYSASTGEFLWEERTSTWGGTPRFSPDGCDVWCVRYSGGAEVWRVGGGRKMSDPLVDMEHPPDGYPWGSSRGYRITDDWWILGPDGKRLLLLAPLWQSYPILRVWKGRFLALLHGLPEPVILELEVNRDL